MQKNVKHINELTVDEIVLLVNQKNLNSAAYQNNQKSSHIDIIRQIILDGGDTKLLSEFEILTTQLQGDPNRQNSHMRSTIPKGENFNPDKWLFEKKNGEGSWDRELLRRKKIQSEYVEELHKLEETKHTEEKFELNHAMKLEITAKAVESLITIDKERQSAIDAIQQAGYTIVNEDDIVDYVQPNLRKIRKKLLEAGFHVIQDNLIDSFGQTIIPENAQILGTNAEIGVKPGDKSVHVGDDKNKFYQTLEGKKIEVEEKFYEKILAPYGALPKSTQSGFLEYFKERDQLVEDWHEQRESLFMLASAVKYKQIEGVFSLHNETLENIIGSVPEEEYMTTQEQTDKHAKFRLENLHPTTVEHMQKTRYEMDQLDLPFEFDLKDLNIEEDVQMQSIDKPNPLHKIIDADSALKNKPGIKPGYSLEQIEEAARNAQKQIQDFFASRNMKNLQHLLDAYQIVSRDPQLYLSPSLQKRFVLLKGQLTKFREQYNGVYTKATTLIKGGAEILEQISVKGIKETFKDNFQQFLDVMQDEAYGNSHTVAFFNLVDDFYKKVDTKNLLDKAKETMKDVIIKSQDTSEASFDRETRTQKKKSLWNQFKDFIQSDVVQQVSKFFDDNYAKIQTLVSVTTGFNIDYIKVAYDYGKQIYHYADKVFDENYGLINIFNGTKQQQENQKGQENVLKSQLTNVEVTKIRG